MVTYIYATSFVIGLLWLIVQVFFGGDAEIGADLDADGALDMGDGHVTPLKGIVIAPTLAIFGLVGWSATSMGLFGPAGNGSLAIGAGLLGGWVMAKLMAFLVKSQSNGAERQSDFVGVEGELTTACSAEATGEIMFTTPGGIRQMSAKPADPDAAISKGTRVVIRRIVGGVAYVDPA